jgi:[ribosomal protein S5]-alanine N-acetyltransferase
LKPLISGSRLYLRPIEVTDASGAYLKWMNDPEITAMLESRFRRYSAEDLSDYILSMTTTGLNVFCAIILKETERHIGNIKMGPMHPYHLSGDIGLMIGEKDCWGKGFATEAISLMCAYGFNELGLHKITAGAYDNNQGSVQAFIKVGFEIEGRRKSMYRVKEEWVDGILLGMLNPAEKSSSEIAVDRFKFPKP